MTRSENETAQKSASEQSTPDEREGCPSRARKKQLPRGVYQANACCGRFRKEADLHFWREYGEDWRTCAPERGCRR